MTCKRGVSLVEFLIVFSIIILIFVVVISVMRFGQRTQVETQGLASLTGEMLSSARTLRRDLQATAIGSIAVFDSDPSLSMASFGEKDQTTQFAAPNWKGHVFYTLQTSSKGTPGTAQLIRWEAQTAKPSLYPKATTIKPWDVPSDGKKRILAKKVLAKGWTVESKPGGYRLTEDQTSSGGFVPRFVRLTSDGETELSLQNPTSLTDYDQSDWSSGSTTLVSVKLRLLEVRGNKLSTVEFEVKAQPRN